MNLRVMLEIIPSANFDLQNADSLAVQMKKLGFELDPDSTPVPMGEQGHGANRKPTSVILTGSVADSAALEILESRPDVLNIWGDTKIAPFNP